MADQVTVPGRDRDGQLNRADPGAGCEQRLAGSDVLAGKPDVEPGASVDPELDDVTGKLGLLMGNDGVCQRREGRAGRDADGGRVVEPGRGRPPGERLTDQAQAAAGGSGDHGEAVHRAVVERGDVRPGGQRPGEDAAERGGDGDGLRRERGTGADDATAGGRQ